jgi:hypothetical protein
MASTRRRVSFPGILRGQEQEARCTVTATEVSLPGVATYRCEYSITNVSKALPGGEYQLSTNGEVIAVRYQNGAWLSAFPG